jgi:hypothetical protein
VEPVIPATGGGYTIKPTEPTNGYTIISTASGGEAHTFTLERTGEGGLVYTCTVGGKGGCPVGGDWSK